MTIPARPYSASRVAALGATGPTPAVASTSRLCSYDPPSARGPHQGQVNFCARQDPCSPTASGQGAVQGSSGGHHQARQQLETIGVRIRGARVQSHSPPHQHRHLLSHASGVGSARKPCQGRSAAAPSGPGVKGVHVSPTKGPMPLVRCIPANASIGGDPCDQVVPPACLRREDTNSADDAGMFAPSGQCHKERPKQQEHESFVIDIVGHEVREMMLEHFRKREDRSCEDIDCLVNSALRQLPPSLRLMPAREALKLFQSEAAAAEANKAVERRAEVGMDAAAGGVEHEKVAEVERRLEELHQADKLADKIQKTHKNLECMTSEQRHSMIGELQNACEDLCRPTHNMMGRIGGA